MYCFFYFFSNIADPLIDFYIWAKRIDHRLLLACGSSSMCTGVTEKCSSITSSIAIGKCKHCYHCSKIVQGVLFVFRAESSYAIFWEEHGVWSDNS
jgi:predicted membrane chloride channel (bestrophin family)